MDEIENKILEKYLKKPQVQREKLKSEKGKEMKKYLHRWAEIAKAKKGL